MVAGGIGTPGIIQRISRWSKAPVLWVAPGQYYFHSNRDPATLITEVMQGFSLPSQVW